MATSCVEYAASAAATAAGRSARRRAQARQVPAPLIKSATCAAVACTDENSNNASGGTAIPNCFSTKAETAQ